MPFRSARRHRLESLASQLPESGGGAPRFNVLALASSRQSVYRATAFSLANSHLPGAAAHTPASSSSIAARAAFAAAIAAVVMVGRHPVRLLRQDPGSRYSRRDRDVN